MIIQTILSPTQLWPDGIPSAVRLNPNNVLDEHHPEEEIKGWCQYLKASWNPLPNPSDDKAQRRALVEKWASADQCFRDSFHLGAPVQKMRKEFGGSYSSKRFVCLVDKPNDPEIYSRITRLLILLYIHLGHTDAHPLSFGQDKAPQIPAFMLDPTLGEQYTRLLPPENLPVNYYLETADFSAMAMTRAGTVIFPFLIWQAFFVIDNQSCHDGRVRMLNFGSNGQIMQEARMRPFGIGGLTQLHCILGHLWDELFERPNTSPRWNKPIDLNPPILDIMAMLRQCGDLWTFNDYTPAEWAEEFERFAPEFLAYERQGRVTEYSWDRLLDASVARYQHFRTERQVAAALGR